MCSSKTNVITTPPRNPENPETPKTRNPKLQILNLMPTNTARKVCACTSDVGMRKWRNLRMCKWQSGLTIGPNIYIYFMSFILKDWNFPPLLPRLPKAQSSGSGSDDVATAAGHSITQWEMVEVEAQERLRFGQHFWVGNKKKKTRHPPAKR